MVDEELFPDVVFDLISELTSEELLSEETISKYILDEHDAIAADRNEGLLSAQAKKLSIPSEFKKFLNKCKLQKAKADNLQNEKEWIIASIDKKTGDIKYKINCPMLAEHIKNSQKYIYVFTYEGAAPIRYVYRNTGIYVPITDDEVKGVIKSFIPLSLQSAGTIENVFKLFKYDIDNVITPREALNDNENIINFQNGLLDIRDMKLYEHTDKELTTVQLPIKYNSESYDSPVFDSFIYTLSGGDKKTIKLLLQYIGLAISNIAVSKTKTALLLVGKGNTGKSQYSALISRLVGPANYTTIDFANLEANRFESSRLFGKRLAVDDDMQYSKVRELSKFKKLTGGDSIPGEYKGGALFNFQFKGLILLCANQKPKFGGDKGEHVYNRFVAVECNNVIPPAKQDRYLIDKLYNERTAIVNKALEALRELKENNYSFDLPDNSIKAIQEYKVDNSSILSFLNECCVLRTDPPKRNDTITTGRIFTAYKFWCDKYNNGHKEIKSAFRKELYNYYNDEIEIRKDYGRYYIFTLTYAAKKDLGIIDYNG